MNARKIILIIVSELKTGSLKEVSLLFLIICCTVFTIIHIKHIGIIDNTAKNCKRVLTNGKYCDIIQVY